MAQLPLPHRTQPRLWVEKLWILESLEAEQPIREIPLTLGLNLILSPPVDGSTGHGVGKTAFCQLLRFALEDPQWAAGSPLREELLLAFPDGAVAAAVHVAGEVWTVVKPWRYQKQYRAGRSASWRQVARDEVENEHDDYLVALKANLIDILPVGRLPGSNQAIQWQHVLAWCSRDQGSRYQSYYHWRTEGAGLTFPAQSPAAIVRIVLGLLRDVTTLDELHREEDNLRKVENELVEISRRPGDLMAHVKHQLAEVLGANDASPFRATTLFDVSSLLALAKQRKSAHEQARENARNEQIQADFTRTELIERRVLLARQAAMLRNIVARIEAAITGNQAELEELRKQPHALESMFPQMCEPGNRFFRDCQYVVDRVNTLSFEAAQTVSHRRAAQRDLKAQLSVQKARLDEVERALEPLERAVKAASIAMEQAKDRELSARGDLQRLDEAIRDYEFYEDVVSGKAEWAELSARQESIRALRQTVDQLQLEAEAERNAHAERRRTIGEVIDTVAKQLPGFAWGVFNEASPHPFHIGPLHSTTFGVLETLAGDVACLLDSSHPDSLHPGFLLHDSPREAEMSGAVFWALLAAAPQSPESPCQYIVTTSTEAPLKFSPYIRLTLDGRNDSELLFKRRIGAETKPLSI